MSGASRAVAVIPTFRRRGELRRLLRGLAQCGEWVAGVVIADNAEEEDLREVCGGELGELRGVFLTCPGNPGPGAAWKLGMETAARLFPPSSFSHFLCLDDDVCVTPENIRPVFEVARETGAGLVAPLLSDSRGLLWGFPEPAEPALRRAIRKCRTPEDARARLGDAPIPLVWCTGACVLFRRQAIEECGPHRADFFLLGEDLELSMRISSRLPAVFTCRSTVPHLPPIPRDPRAASLHEHIKFCALLQNLGYLSFHVPHRHHMRRYLAGNFKRFLLQTGPDFPRLLDAIACFAGGVLHGEPAGGPRGSKLRERIRRRPA